MKRYLIDSSSLIELENKYPSDISFFKPIYLKIDDMFKDGEIFSLKEVFNELKDSQEFISKILVLFCIRVFRYELHEIQTIVSA